MNEDKLKSILQKLSEHEKVFSVQYYKNVTYSDGEYQRNWAGIDVHFNFKDATNAQEARQNIAEASKILSPLCDKLEKTFTSQGNIELTGKTKDGIKVEAYIWTEFENPLEALNELFDCEVIIEERQQPAHVTRRYACKPKK